MSLCSNNFQAYSTTLSVTCISLWGIGHVLDCRSSYNQTNILFRDCDVALLPYLMYADLGLEVRPCFNSGFCFFLCVCYAGCCSLSQRPVLYLWKYAQLQLQCFHFRQGRGHDLDIFSGPKAPNLEGRKSGPDWARCYSCSTQLRDQAR